MLAEEEELTAVGGFPDKDIAVAVCRGEQDAVRAELRGQHPVRVLGNGVELFTGGHVKHLDLLRRTADHHLAVVGADVGRHDGIEFLADFRHSFAGLHIPDHGLAHLATTAPAHDQERAAAAEFQRASVAFRIGEDTGKLLGVGVIQQHLLGAGECHERGPGAGRHGDHRRGARGHHHGLQQHVFRLRDGPGGLAGAGGDVQVHLRLAGFLGDA